MKKMLSMLLIFCLCALPACIGLAEAEKDIFVLMNIPYAEFYAAELGENDAAVDAITSATLKFENSSVAAGSYHETDAATDAESQAVGVIFPVFVSDLSALNAELAITDETTKTINIVSGREKTVTATEVTGQDALFCAPTYSWYLLEQAPARYKTLTVGEDDSFTFGAVSGRATAVSDVTGTVSYNTHHGCYAEAKLNGITITENVNGVIVTVRAEPGVFPEGAELSVERVPVYQQAQADAAVEEVRDENVNVAVSYTFDIRVIDPETGEEIQPTEGQTVSVSFALAEVADENLETSVYHVTEDETTGALSAEALDVTHEDAVTATVETDGFSLYTVEFTYNTLEYVLPGDSSVAMSEIISTLGLTGEVEAVSISDTSLFSASNETGEWIVTAHQAFFTTEWMKVTINGMVYEITVTDSTPAEAGQGFTVTCSGNKFTISRTDTTAAASVKYRTVSQSAVAGIHFTAAGGTLTFAAGQSSKTVTVTEASATASVDFFYTSGSTRTYGFEVLAASNNQLLASCQRTLDNDTGLALSSGLYSTKTATVFTSETKVTDGGYNQAYYPVPLDYSTGERDYFRLTGAELRMTVDFEAKEADDGYQYIQIIANNAANCDSGAGDGSPGTVNLSSYMAGFSHYHSGKNGDYYKYSFPLTDYGSNCGKVEKAWSGLGNTVGDLWQQLFNTDCRADDGKLILPAGLRTLGIRLNASGSGDDDWYAKNVIANLQAVDTAAPTITNTYITEGTYGYRDTVTIALRFSEVVQVTYTNKLYLNTNIGTFAYAGGSGTNVLYFTKQMTDSTSVVTSGLQITDIVYSGSWLRDLAGNYYGSAYTAPSFPGVNYEGSYTVTVNYNDGTGGSTSSRYRLNATYTFPAATQYQSHAPQGHELDCYKVGDTAYQPGDTLELTGNLTVDLQWKPIVYTVRFENWDGTELQSGGVVYGETPEYTGETPTRPADAQYTYSFTGWTPEITAVSGDATYTAAYSTTTNEYTVTFQNHDGTALQTGSVPYGETPAYTGDTPVKEQTVETVYTFAGWTPEIAPVTGDATYTATFTGATRPYIITFENYDGTVLQSGPVSYGETPAYNGETPTRPDEGEPRYFFAGWTPEITAVTVEATYTATYSTTQLYPITLPEGITADKALAAPGETVTLTAPEAYTVELTVRQSEGKIQTVQGENGTYTFSMPAAPVTVEASFSLTWAGLQTLLDAGGTVKLLCDVTAGAASSYLQVPTGVTVTLDLNGHTVDRALTEAVSGGNVLEIFGSLTLRDNSAGKTGRITGGYSRAVCGGVFVSRTGTFIMEGGTIERNTTVESGGGVFVHGGSFTMKGGAIDRNTARYAGGVYMYTGSTFAMEGGEIEDNTASSYGGGVIVNGTFTMTGGTITGNTASSDSGGVFVSSTGTFIMEGGAISDNTAAYGGGVYVNTGGTFTMEGGEITGNTTTSGIGGGVYVSGTFNMEDGAISGNTATDDGGGVYVDSGTFNMEDGTIEDNTANYYGGGVYVYTSGTFIMTGGTISGNTAYYGGGVCVSNDGAFNMTGGTISSNNAYDGGGVCVYGTFSVSGSPVVTGNTKNSNGTANNVYLSSDKAITLSGELSGGASLGVTMKDSTGVFTSGLSGNGTAANFASDNDAYGVYLSGGEAALSQLYAVTIADDIEHGTVTANRASAVSGDTVTLIVTPEAGYALDTLTVKQGEMDLTTTPGENGAYTFTMSGGDATVTATFTMTWASLNTALKSDCAITLPYDITAEASDGPLVIPGGVTVTLDLNGHVLSRGLTEAADTGYVLGVEGGTLTLTDSASGAAHNGTEVTGGILTGGNCSGHYGSAVDITNGGTFLMLGGTITGNINRSTEKSGSGGVAVFSGTFAMKGGAISNNERGQSGSTNDYGGGVTVYDTFIMEGGTISNNSAYYNGGGVYVYRDGTFIMQGGRITNNTARLGGGVYVWGSFTMSGGSPTVTGNQHSSSGNANNVYLFSGTVITVSGSLNTGASLGVTMNTPGVFTSGWAAQMDTASPADYFTSDNSAYAAHLGTGGEAELGQAYTVSVTDGIAHGTVTADKASAAEGDTVTLTVTPEDGYALDTLTVTQGETAVTVENDQFTMPESNVTVTATFAERTDTVVIRYANLTLEGQIGLNFKLDIPDTIKNADGAKVILTYRGNDTEFPLNGASKNDQGLYVITQQVPAKEVAQPITLQVVNGEGTAYTLVKASGGTCENDEFSYAVTDYCAAALASDGVTENLKSLVAALQNYGYYAWLHFNPTGITQPAPASAADLSGVTAAALEAHTIQKSGSVPGLALTSMFLTLESETDINLRFTPEEGTDIGNYTFRLGETVLTPVQSGETWVVKIPNIPAKELDTRYTVTVTKDRTEETLTVTCSALSYAWLALTKSSDSALQDAMKAMKLYNDAANTFFAS